LDLDLRQAGDWLHGVEVIQLGLQPDCSGVISPSI
jgi:hypothetical protein